MANWMRKLTPELVNRLGAETSRPSFPARSFEGSSSDLHALGRPMPPAGPRDPLFIPTTERTQASLDHIATLGIVRGGGR